MANPDGPTVIWLQGTGLTGCTESILNRISDSTPRTAADVLMESINLTYHPTVMALAGQSAVEEVITAANNGGYVLVRDDGVGIHAVRKFKRRSLRGFAVEVGTGVFQALYLLEWADRVLVIDAMEAGNSPGTLYSFGVNDVAEPAPGVSLHELSLLGALRLLPNHRFPQIDMVGVEPEVIDYGLSLSLSPKATVPHLISRVENTIADWKRPSHFHSNTDHSSIRIL